MRSALPASLGFSLLATLLLESALFFLTGKRDRKDLLLVALVNVLTNPVAVLSYWLAVLYTALHPVAVKTCLELAAMVVEGACYRTYGRDFRRPFLFSAAANALSFSVGLILNRLL